MTKLSQTKPTQALPLAGIRVIDYSHFLAGPHISRCLSAMGAEVIKVERPVAGDAGRASPTIVKGQSGYFMQQNMGKQGLCINLRDPRGLGMMHKLTDSADVFVENYRPGALNKLGLGYDELAGRNSKLVYCSVSAYGHTGPDSHRPGFGLIAEAKSGAMSLIGVPGEPPPLFRMPIADMYAGMHGVSAICAALFGRVSSGRGQHIDIALYDCMISMHDFAAQSYLMSGGTELPVQTGHDLPQSTVYGSFAAKDGYLVIAAQMTDTWKSLAQLIGGEAYAADTRFHDQAGRNMHREAILAKVQAWALVQASVADCCAQLDAAGVPAAPVQTIDKVLSDPQTLARGMVVEQDHPLLGKIELPNLPFRFSECDTSPSGPAPLLGQHNRDIAASVGYSAQEIDTFVKDGVLYAEDAVSQLENRSAS
ncbi:CaiB/BaiF CoA transferase family protein [Rhodoferax ferrireducens]|uniref:CaiB/BaiF CoA transferase family protein n=1 Tax=Rhodoferax ferrireducens TaxID=192843 RepID=UPI000E0D90B9|nr:CoA transferase [Rhodoferax ferrireducens]